MKRAATLFLLSLIAAAASAETVTLHLTDGTVLQGEIIKEADGKVHFKTQLLGEIDVPEAAIVGRGAALAGATPPPTTPPAEAPPAAAAAAATSTVTWIRSFGIGGNYVSAPFIQGPVDGSVPNVTGKLLRLPGAQWNGQAMLNLVRNTQTRGWFLNASITEVDAEPTGRLTETYALETNYTQYYRADDYVVARLEFKRDAVRNIDGHVVQSFGVGRRVRNTPHLRIDLIGGIDFRREKAGTPYDGDILPGYGMMQMLSWSNKVGVGFDERLILRTLLKSSDLWYMEFYAGVRAPITKTIAFTVGLTHTYDGMLGVQRLDIPADAFFPGSPAAVFFANNKRNTQLTTGLQLKF
jgi:hypothetical protein